LEKRDYGEHQVISSIIDNICRIFEMLSERSKKEYHETGLIGPPLWAIMVMSDHSPVHVLDFANMRRWNKKLPCDFVPINDDSRSLYSNQPRHLWLDEIIHEMNEVWRQIQQEGVMHAAS
jgi:hypothetical protein